MERVPEDPAVGGPDAAGPEDGAELREVRRQLRIAQGKLEAAQESIRGGREREGRLEHELQHRVRNMLAVIRSVFARSMATRTSLEDASDHFKGRLDTLARYQSRSALGLNLGHEVEDMVRDELVNAASADDPRIAISGPAVSLSGLPAESLGLVLHELVTNSIKFGLLSPGHTTGGLLVEWQRDEDRLRFKWVESGVSVVASAPLRRGFGREYIEDSLPYQVDAVTSFEIAPGRIACLIDLPLTQ
jgi:two-component system CheB/CheR fusion protein